MTMITLKRVWIALGVALVALVAFTVYVQTKDVDGENRKRADDIVKEWDKKASPAPTSTPEPKKTALPEPKYAFAPGKAFGVVRIPSIGISFPVGEGVGDGVLNKGLGHYNGTAGPGQKGNFAVAGHVCCANHGEPFRYLYKLRPGDQVIVETKEYRFTYKSVRLTTCGPLTGPNSHLIVGTDEIHVINPIPCTSQAPSRRLMTMTTCHPYTSEPTPIRLIAFAELTSATRRSA